MQKHSEKNNNNNLVMCWSIKLILNVLAAEIVVARIRRFRTLQRSQWNENKEQRLT